MSKIAEELEAVGYRGDVASFDVLLVQNKVRFRPTWTVDRLLVHPGIAIRFCGIVRREAETRGLHDDTIVRRLLNIRKNDRKLRTLLRPRNPARSVPFRLQHQLEAAGYFGDPDAFYEAALDLMASTSPNWTEDELLIHPSESGQLCGLVRHRTGADNVPDWVILAALLNGRKRCLRYS